MPWISPVCSACSRAAVSPIGRKITRCSFGFGPQYLGLATSSSLLPICHDESMYGPVPIGCWVANVPVGWKTPVASTVPASASYFLSAVGLAMPKFGNPIADRKDEERCVSRIDTEYVPCALQ